MGVGRSEEKLPSPPEHMQVVEKPGNGNVKGRSFL